MPTQECQRCGGVANGTYCRPCDEVIRARIRRWAEGERDQLVKEFAQEVGLTEGALAARLKRMGYRR